MHNCIYCLIFNLIKYKLIIYKNASLPFAVYAAVDFMILCLCFLPAANKISISNLYACVVCVCVCVHTPIDCQNLLPFPFAFSFSFSLYLFFISSHFYFHFSLSARYSCSSQASDSYAFQLFYHPPTVCGMCRGMLLVAQFIKLFNLEHAYAMCAVLV